MDDQSILSVLVALTVIGGGAWAVWWKIRDYVREETNQIRKESQLAHAEARLAREQLNEFKVVVSDHFISKKGFNETMTRFESLFMSGIGRIDTSITNLNTRIDTLFDNRNTTKGNEQ